MLVDKNLRKLDDFLMKPVSRKFYIQKFGDFLSYKISFEIRSYDGGFNSHAFEVGHFLSSILNLFVFRTLLPLKIIFQNRYGERLFVLERPASWIYKGETLLRKDVDGRLIARLNQNFIANKILIKDPLDRVRAVVRRKGGIGLIGKQYYEILNPDEREVMGTFRWKGWLLANRCELELKEAAEDEFLFAVSLASAVQVCLYILKK